MSNANQILKDLGNQIALIAFNHETYDAFTDANESGALYDLKYRCDVSELQSEQTAAIIRAAYMAAECLDGNNGLVVFAVSNSNAGGFIWPAEVGLNI